MSEAGSPYMVSSAQDVVARWYRSRLVRTVLVAASILIGAFVVSRALILSREVAALWAEESGVRRSVAIGYPGIQPHFSYARRPKDWIHDEGDQTLLWGGWHGPQGHHWFKVGKGEIERSKISDPFGRDSIRAIDVPVVEQGGGRVWSTIPEEAPVAVSRLEGVETAYPLTVLEKVLVINDTVGGRPFLVLCSPFATGEEKITVYDPVVEGRRLSMGVAGYFHDDKPLFYDRGTESLWSAETNALVAITGRQKGLKFPRVARPVQESWGRWRTAHPDGRLVIGADRSRARPES